MVRYNSEASVVLQSVSGELEIAGVLFMDLVAYSRQQMERQREMISQLGKIVGESPSVQRAAAAGHLIQIPTGDGMALVFSHDPTVSAQSAVEIALAIRDSGLQLRMGLHTGPVFPVTDINANRNVAGGGINIAQRVMDCGDAGHILVSGAMAEILHQVGRWSEYLRDLGECKVKHGVRVRLFNLCAPEVGNPALPAKLRFGASLFRIFSNLVLFANGLLGTSPWRRFIASALAVIVLAALVWTALALPAYRRSQATPSAEAVSWYQEGMKAIREGTYYRATKALDRAAILSPNFPMVYARLAEAWSEIDSPQRANKAMLTAAMLGMNSLSRVDRLVMQAEHKTLINDFGGAVHDHEEILRLAPPTEKQYAYVELGRALEKANDPRKALDCYSQAAKRAPQYAGAFLHLAILCARFHDLATAASAFDSAAAIYEASSDMEGLTEVLFQRGNFANQEGDSAEARRLLDHALESARMVSNPHQQARILLKLSSVAYNTGNLALSEQKAAEAIQLAKDSGIDNLTSRAIVDLGTALFMRGESDRAERYFQEGLASAQRYENRRTEAAALYMLGDLHIRNDKSEQGAHEIEQALSFYRTNGFYREAAQCLVLLGRYQTGQGHYDVALKTFGDQLEIANRNSDPSLAAFAHEGLGSAFLQQERYPEALDQFRQNYQAVEPMKDPDRLAWALLQQAAALWRLGRYEEASRFVDSISVVIPDQAAYQSLAPDIRSIRAQMALSRRSYSQAISWARKSPALAGGPDPGASAEIRQVLCLALVRSGAAGEGVKVCEQALPAAETAGDPKLLSSVRLALSEAQLRTGALAPARTGIEQQAQVLEKLGCLDSLRYAWSLDAEAAVLAHDAAGSQAAREREQAVLGKIRSSWSPEAFAAYLNRPDVSKYLANSRDLGFNLRPK